MAEIARGHVDVNAAAESSIGRPPPAALIRRALTQSRILGIRIIGHPGSGKTELIEATLKRLPAPRRVALIVVNPASGRDAQRLQKLCGHVSHIDAAVPDAAAIWRAISQLSLDDFDTLLIEAPGGLAELHDLGQDATVAVFAISGGDDKAAEYHALLKTASAILLTKIDLRPFVKFDAQVFRNDIRAINSSAEIHETSAMTGTGISAWLDWMDRTRAHKALSRLRGDPHEGPSDEFIG